MKEQISLKPTETTILIVEDSPTQLEALRYQLEEYGYKIISATNGLEAIELLKEHRSTIIISDILMPEMDGFELCRYIKADENLKDIPVVFLTQLTEPEDIIKGLDCGADNFILKPYKDEFLHCRIQYILVNMELQKRVVTRMNLQISLEGKIYTITPDRMQILDLLFYTFTTLLRKNRELEQKNKELHDALDTIKTLRGLLPICASCKRIRDDEGYWHSLEIYIKEHSEAEFTHGLCPECVKKLYPDFLK